MNVSRGRLAGGRSILLPGICLSLVLALAPASWGAPGDQVWVNRYKGPGRSIDNAKALGVSPDGARVFVTGSSQGSAGEYDYDYATVAYDAATGAELWAMRYKGPGTSSITPLLSG